MNEVKSLDLFKDILPSLNLKENHFFDEGILEEKDYNSYIINLAYSFGLDTILYANEMNCKSFINNRLQYDFYFYGLDKRKRFNKWIKKDDYSVIESLKKYFCCSTRKAKQYKKILTETQLEEIFQFLKHTEEYEKSNNNQ